MVAYQDPTSFSLRLSRITGNPLPGIPQIRSDQRARVAPASVQFLEQDVLSRARVQMGLLRQLRQLRQLRDL